jgi:nicotinamidase-related amidase
MNTLEQITEPRSVLEGLRHWMPVEAGEAKLGEGVLGLVLVDPVVGFTRSGFLSDPVSMAPMVAAIDALCRDLLQSLGQRLVIYVFRDHHGPTQLEPPYPPHCQEGSGEELLDPDLRWLEALPQVTVRAKDCINGMIGALDLVGEGAYRHHFVDWVKAHDVGALMVVGDCTDICDLDFVVSALSARNHGMFGSERAQMPVMVYGPACATFHLPDPQALGLPLTARHDKDLCHHAALYFMQARGAVIVDRYQVEG